LLLVLAKRQMHKGTYILHLPFSSVLPFLFSIFNPRIFNAEFSAGASPCPTKCILEFVKYKNTILILDMV